MTTFVLESDCAEVAENLGELAHGFGGKTLVVTGAGGFLGQYLKGVAAHLNSHILNDPLSVIALDNFIVSDEAAAQDDGNNHYVMRNHNVIEPIEIEGQVDFVVHAAGIASPYHYRAYPLETLEVATTGTKHMLNLAREKRARLLFFSSSEIYGDPDPNHVPTPESYRGNVSCQGPRACYDESKRLGETLCYVYNTYYGVACNSVRPFNVYGPGMRENDYRVLPNFASRIKAGKPLNVYGNGNQTRTYCYVTDALSGFLRILLRGVPGETYNIGNPSPEISVNELANRISSVLGHEVPRNLIEYPDSYPADEPNRRCPDIRKARTQLGYEPKVPIEDGLRRFFDWADRQYVGSV
ncbi:MAG: NAD-dependent epimerase/dehydratase family protein [Gammaproteobacteria bacterium]|nr:NAD-dependent epimerase/dehydratase family protein [Gammaproteobacteria bacterium]